MKVNTRIKIRTQIGIRIRIRVRIRIRIRKWSRTRFLAFFLSCFGAPVQTQAPGKKKQSFNFMKVEIQA